MNIPAMILNFGRIGQLVCTNGFQCFRRIKLSNEQFRCNFSATSILMKQNVVVKEQKFKNSKITQKQMAQYLGCSDSKKKRYRVDINWRARITEMKRHEEILIITSIETL